MNLEFILDEVRVLALIIDSISDKPSKTRDHSNLILLNSLQQLCSKWWESSREFFVLAQLYSQDDFQISQLINRSQVLLVIAVGCVAVTTLIMSKDSTSKALKFQLIAKALKVAYLTEIKLC